MTGAQLLQSHHQDAKTVTIWFIRIVLPNLFGSRGLNFGRNVCIRGRRCANLGVEVTWDTMVIKNGILPYLRCAVLTVFVLFYGLSIFAQSRVISSVILNEKTLEPVPFVNVAIRGTFKGTYSDDFGRFALKAEDDDTVELSSVGFAHKSLPARQILDTILFSPKINVLDEVVVSASSSFDPNQRVDRLGYFDEKNSGLFLGHKQVALRFSNESGREGVIGKVLLRIGHSVKKDFGKHRVVIRLKTIGNDQLPGVEFYSVKDPLLILPRKQSIEFDLSDTPVIFPKKGCFLIVEFHGYFSGDRFLPYNNTERLEYPYAPSFSTGHKFPRSYVGNGNYWRLLNTQTNGRGFMNLNFSLDVKFFD